MSERTQVAHLVAELAASVGIDEMQLGDDGTCSLLFDEDLAVHIAHLEAEHHLALFCYLGQPQGDEPALYRLLLEANFFWGGADGATLSVESESGGVVLMDRVPAEGLDLSGFTAALERFVNAADGWRSRLDAPGQKADEPTDPAAGPHMTHHIRA